MTVKLKNAPVFYVIAQVRFNTIKSMEDFVPRIQERFRKSGFPDFQSLVMQTIHIPHNAIDNSEVRSTPQKSYRFGNLEKTESFSLNENAISFETTDHQVFSYFCGRLMSGVEIVNEVAELAFTERLGLRYLDAVVPVSGDVSGMSKWINPTLLGLSGKINADIVHSYCETHSVVDQVHSVARVLARQGPLAVPPDIGTIALTIKEQFTAIEGPHALVDIDAFSETRMAFDFGSVEGVLNELHVACATAFTSIVTEHALNAWS